MKQNNVFLFYYALVATTILLSVSFFFLPNPQKIINIILMAPVVFYLWVNAISPDYFNAPRWSPKLGAISIVFCILGIFTYFVSIKLPSYLPSPKLITNEVRLDNINQPNTDITDLKTYFDKKFDILNTKIDTIGKHDVNVLGLTIPPEATPEITLGQITAKDASLTDIPIYETQMLSANVVGSAKFGTTYSYSEKLTGWYKISEGWVEARWFSEVQH